MIKILSEAQILFLHDALIKRFGGAEGVLNQSMLKSALQSGLVTFDSKDLFPTDLEKIVRISYGLITNHAFRDGNKRVGIGALILMLDENNINIKISHKDLIGIGYAVGSGTMDYEKMLDKIRKRLQEKLILDEALFKEYNDNNEQLYKEIASQVRKEIVDKYGEDFLYGKCIEASDKIVTKLNHYDIASVPVEGWVWYDYDDGCTDRPYDEHTWVETEDGYVIDVTATQFNHFMNEDYPAVIVQNELPYGYSYDEPDNYLDDYSDEDWYYNKHKIIHEDVTMKIKKFLAENKSLNCIYCNTSLNDDDQKCPSCDASRQEILNYYKNKEDKLAKQKEDSRKKWVADIVDWSDSKNIKTIASNRFFNLSEALNWLKSYNNYSHIKNGIIIIEMGDEYKQKAIPIKDGKVTIPNEMELVKPNKYNVQGLNEAKKRKKSKKRISDVKAGDPIFKSINKMKEWVKKRQKGQGYFVTYDVGNMDYNNMMFNKMHGASDIGASNNDGIEGDVSSSDVGIGIGMGESLKVMDKKDIHFSSKVKSFINNPKYKQLIDDEEWDELFMEYAEKELSMEEQSQLVELLQSIGCDFEVLD